ncbi:hypothetical protein ScalyP_jg2991 [Parmales sp. scaly parma]|nr:hypothetical protein ScalyP_jg2991 [Parmales sp. scaly parma]
MFAEAAESFRGTRSSPHPIKFVDFQNEEVCSELKLSNNEIRLVTETEQISYNMHTVSGLRNFVNGFTVPLLVTYDANNANAIFFGGQSHHVLIFLDFNNKDNNEVISQQASIVAGSNDFRGKFMFVVVPAHETKMVEYFGVTNFPRIIVTDGKGERGLLKYSFPGGESPDDFSSTKIAAFLSDFSDGKLPIGTKSDEPAESDALHKVKIVRGKTFQKMVMENPRGVLLALHAPYCGHSKRLLPILNKLAEFLGDQVKFDIMSMDATRNEIDHPEVEVTSFPVVYFFPAGDKMKPFLMSGNRELDDFIVFLNEAEQK